jgi:iron complex transport system substrate-binding protein
MRGLLFAASLALSGAATSAALIDDAGRSVPLDPPVRRIVTLAPNLTELVHAVGAGAALVATDQSSNHPPEVTSLPRVGDHQRVDIERLVALAPDLVLAWGSGNTARELAQLESAGIRLFRLEPRRLDDIPRALERVGQLLGRAEEGRQRARALRSEIYALRARHAQSAPVRVFYQVWPRPLLTLNDDHLVSDVLRLCGGRNVFGTLGPLVPEVSAESVVSVDPEAMLTAIEGSGPARRTPDAASFSQWISLGATTAVRRTWLYTLPADIVVRGGPRIADGARSLCGVLDEVRRERAEGRAPGRR